MILSVDAESVLSQLARGFAYDCFPDAINELIEGGMAERSLDDQLRCTDFGMAVYYAGLLSESQKSTLAWMCLSVVASGSAHLVDDIIGCDEVA